MHAHTQARTHTRTHARTHAISDHHTACVPRWQDGGTNAVSPHPGSISRSLPSWPLSLSDSLYLTHSRAVSVVLSLALALSRALALTPSKSPSPTRSRAASSRWLLYPFARPFLSPCSLFHLHPRVTLGTPMRASMSVLTFNTTGTVRRRESAGPTKPEYHSMPPQSRPGSRDYGSLPHVNLNAGAKRLDRDEGGERVRNSTASRSNVTSMGHTPSLPRRNICVALLSLRRSVPSAIMYVYSCGGD